MWKAGASPGASNTFPSEQVGGWCSGAAAAAFPCPWHQIHSRRLGESQLWSLNTDAALPRQKRALSEDQCHQKTRKVCKSWDGPGGGEPRTRPGADLHLPVPSPAGIRESSVQRTPAVPPVAEPRYCLSARSAGLIPASSDPPLTLTAQQWNTSLPQISTPRSLKYHCPCVFYLTLNSSMLRVVIRVLRSSKPVTIQCNRHQISPSKLIFHPAAHFRVKQ